MMRWLLNMVSAAVLLAACLVFAACAARWFHKESKSEYDPQVSIAVKFQEFASRDLSEVKVSALVEKAAQFALYLNPPGSPETRPAVVRAASQRPVFSPTVTAKFRLLSTSCYVNNPEKSLALVSEPGKGEHWIAKGQSIGNFIVDRVERGALYYHDANQAYVINVVAHGTSRISQVIPPERNHLPGSAPDREKLSKARAATETLRNRQGLSNVTQSTGFVTEE